MRIEPVLAEEEGLPLGRRRLLDRVERPRVEQEAVLPARPRAPLLQVQRVDLGRPLLPGCAGGPVEDLTGPSVKFTGLAQKF